MAMKDSLNFSLLTYCALKDDASCFKIIFEYAWAKSINENNITYRQMKRMQDWVNMLTNEGFSALHYVAVSGSFTMLTLLVEKGGADLEIRNKFGASALHIAAQSDQPLSIYYLV